MWTNLQVTQALSTVVRRSRLLSEIWPAEFRGNRTEKIRDNEEITYVHTVCGDMSFFAIEHAKEQMSRSHFDQGHYIQKTVVEKMT